MRELLSPGADSSAPTMDDGASSVGRDRWRTGALVAGCLAAVIVIAVGAAAGLWFLPFITGLVIGLIARYGRLRAAMSVAVAVAVAAAGWAVPLAWQAGQGEPVGATARTVGALAGLPASAVLVICVTLLVAVIQAVTGMFLARSITRR
jgi:hypothetical protein